MESNFERGASFGRAARPIIERDFGVILETEVPLLIGNPPTQHRFDLASLGREWVLECKNLAWRANGGVPQAKITSINEAVGFLRHLNLKCKKAVILNRATHVSRRETLGEYYARLHRHLLGGIGLLEVDLLTQSIHWLVPAQTA